MVRSANAFCNGMTRKDQNKRIKVGTDQITSLCIFRSKIILIRITKKYFIPDLASFLWIWLGISASRVSAIPSFQADAWKKVFLFRSLSDPDPDWIPDSIRSWIRIRIGNRIQEGKKNHKSREKKKFHVIEGLDVLFWSLKASAVAWTSFMEA